MDPDQASIGSAVQVLIRNDTENDSVATGERVTVDRWTGHHFETLGSVSGGDGVVEVDPQTTGQLMELDTGDPEFPAGEPGWFRLTAQLDVTTGDFGRLDVRGNIQLTEQSAEASDTAAAITAGPSCDDEGVCAASLTDRGVRYEQSCGLVDPALVADEVYAVGEGISEASSRRCGPTSDGGVGDLLRTTSGRALARDVRNRPAGHTRARGGLVSGVPQQSRPN